MDEVVDVRLLIDRLAAAGLLTGNSERLRRFLLRVCEALDAGADVPVSYSELLVVARCGINVGANDSELRAARIQAAREVDAHRLDPRLDALFRLVRFTLEPEGKLATDWFEVLWAFVEQAEAAGLAESLLSQLLVMEFPELSEDRGPDPG